MTSDANAQQDDRILERCPFCGGEDVLVGQQSTTCMTCLASGPKPLEHTKEAARGAWNWRAD